MNGLRSAIGFLTILPLAPSRANGSMASARGWFPFVGLLLGLILACAEILTVFLFATDSGYAPTGIVTYSARPTPSALLWSIILVIMLVAITRALHLDGFMDSCDALLGGFTRQRRLAILRDPHVGAFAVIGVVCLLLVKVVAVAGLSNYAIGRVAVLLLFPCLSRWAMLLTMELFPYVRSDGLGTAFFNAGSRGFRWQLILGFVFTLVASVALAGAVGLMLFAAACAVAWGIGAWATRLLGGVTGDIYGAVNEVTEVAVLLLAVMLTVSSPFAIYSPLLEMLWSSLR